MEKETEERKVTAAALKTADGFRNVIANLGQNTDSLLSQGTYSLDTMHVTRNRQLLEGAYRGAWIVGKMVDTIAEDMTREGITIISDDEPTNITQIQRYMKELSVWDGLKDARRWGDLFGGAVAIILISGQDLSTPLDPETVGQGQFVGLKVLSRWEIWPEMDNLIADFSPDQGLPATYVIRSINDDMNGTRVHYSRLIRFIGIPLPYYQRIAEMYWGASVVERVYDRLLAFDSATLGAANLMMKSYLRVIGVKGLREALAAGGKKETAIIKQFQYIRLMQRNEGLTLLDSEDAFNTHSWSFSGISEGLTAISQQISGSTGIPLIILLGQNPPGLGNTGENDIRIYYDGIASKQEDDLRPVLTKLFPILYRSKFGRPIPEDWDFNFNPLWKMNEKDKSEMFVNDSNAINTLFTSGLISQSIALRELKTLSEVTGRMTNITDEDIEQADAEPPTLGGDLFGQQENTPSEAVKRPVIDDSENHRETIIQKLKRLIRGKNGLQ